MKIKLKRQEREKLLIPFNDFIFNHYGIKKINSDLFSKYNSIIFSRNGNVLEIVNDFYLEQDLYELFTKINSFDEIYSFIEKYYKEILITNIGLDDKYIVSFDNSDARIENAVENGSLVMKIDLLIDFNKQDITVFKTVNELEKDIKKIENNIKEIIGVPVHIFCSKQFVKDNKN